MPRRYSWPRPAAILVIACAAASCGGGSSGSDAGSGAATGAGAATITATSPPGGSNAVSPVTTGATAAPRAIVESPPNAAIVKTRTLSIEGRVDPPDATIIVAGAPATVTDGRFRSSISLVEGANSIDIVAKNSSGETTTTLAVTLNSQEMCGSGETFEVGLTGLRLGADPSTQNLSNRRLPDDSITLPNGCDVYALIVHGYGRNSLFDEFMYYKLAKWVAEHNGYVHYSWWNNLLGEYQSGPLHVIPGAARGEANYPSPGDISKFENVWDFAQGGSGKAVPDEDFQFQADAKLMLGKIRAENPTAIIIVAGHSMGGNAVARLGSQTPVAIDLLAPIDPVGNRNLPEGQGGALAYSNGNSSAVPGAAGYEPGNETFNWTRWRATRTFNGWIDRDCVRNNVNLCRDFDSRPLKIEYRCRTVSSSASNTQHADGPIADKACPDQYEYSFTSFGPDVRRLYHRWQLEAYFPYDWDASYRFPFQLAKVRSDAVFDVRYHNYQRALNEYAQSELPPPSPLATAPKTCKHDTEKDPSSARSFDGTLLACQNWDGHGEIIGMRGTKSRAVFQNVPPQPTKENLNPLALTADWNPGWNRTSPWFPSVTGADDDHCVSTQCRAAAARRRAFAMLAVPGAWTFAPKSPSLDLVVDDLVKIADDLWAQRTGVPSGPDVTPPETSADASPDPTVHGWNNSAVVLTISAAEEHGGSGVKEIAYTLTGASTGSGTVPGDALSIEIAAEGTTTVQYFARDNAGNNGDPTTLEVRIDVTPPTIGGDAAPPANDYGWNNTDVTVTFVAEDALSGLDTVTAPQPLTEEGADQEVLGVATDRAGNTAAAGVVVNIDKTPPEVGGLPEQCVLWPPNHKLVTVADLIVTDALSGVVQNRALGVSNEPESGPGYGNHAPDVVIEGNSISLRAERYSFGGRTYDLTVTAVDRAGNLFTANVSCRVPHDQGDPHGK